MRFHCIFFYSLIIDDKRFVHLRMKYSQMCKLPKFARPSITSVLPTVQFYSYKVLYYKLNPAVG